MSVRAAARALRERRYQSRNKGTVVEIRRDWEDKDKVRLEIEVGRRRRTHVVGDGPHDDVPITETVVVSRAFARGVRLGSEITVTTQVGARDAE